MQLQDLPLNCNLYCILYTVYCILYTISIYILYSYLALLVQRWFELVSSTTIENNDVKYG